MNDDYDSMKAVQMVSDMWLKLAAFIEANVIVVAPDDPVKAIHYACCAEACFWKATGEADTHDVNDVLASVRSQKPQQSITPESGNA